MLTTCRNAVFWQGVTVAVTVEDKLHFFYIVLLQFIVVDAIYLECEFTARVVYEYGSSEGAGNSDEQAKSQCKGFYYAIK